MVYFLASSSFQGLFGARFYLDLFSLEFYSGLTNRHLNNAIVIIPTYNEKENITLIIDSVFSLAKDFDVLIVDGFDADGLPNQLSSQRFYDDCYASLSGNGIMVVNLWGSHLLCDEYLARIQHSFADRVVVVGADDSLNKIALAMKDIELRPSPATIRHHAKLLGLSHPLNFQAKSNKLIGALPDRAI